MKKYIKAGTILPMACLIAGIALFLIYGAAEPAPAGEGDLADKGRQPSRSINAAPEPSAALEVSAAPQFAADTEGDSVSRGKASRSIDQKPAEEPSAPARAKAPEATAPEEKAEQPAASTMVKAPEAAAPEEKAEPSGPAIAKASAPTVPEEQTVEEEPAGREPGDEADLDLLARLITAEAQGEPYEAQVAVGAVVLNRVESSAWPDTIREVIYQEIDGYKQFTPVANGWIDKLALQEAVAAAKEALNGADPTKGAQFYYDDQCTNEWILAKPVSVQIGHMIFAL